MYYFVFGVGLGILWADSKSHKLSIVKNAESQLFSAMDEILLDVQRGIGFISSQNGKHEEQMQKYSSKEMNLSEIKSKYANQQYESYELNQKTYMDDYQNTLNKQTLLESSNHDLPFVQKPMNGSTWYKDAIRDWSSNLVMGKNPNQYMS